MRSIIKRWLIMAAIVLPYSSVEAQDWHRDIPNESCQQFADRYWGPNANPDLWKDNWCARRPCRKRCFAGGQFLWCPNVPNTVHPYWVNGEHGCRCSFGYWDHSIPAGQVKNCGGPVPEIIFENGFEEGDTSGWSKTVNPEGGP